jgi:hypothetical protein
MSKLTVELVVLIAGVVLVSGAAGQTAAENGLNMGMGNLPTLSHAKSRSISAENFTGEKGKGGMATEGTGARAARDLGQGWKISPSIHIPPRQVFTLAEIHDAGAIQHIWISFHGNSRFGILRMYWDGESQPSVEAPIGDFFASGWGMQVPIASLAVCVNPDSALNSYWEMPFRKSAKITLENLDDESVVVFYQIDYTLTTVPASAGYFHAQFRRSNPLPYKTDHVILDGVTGWGQYVGTYIAWGSHNNGWWGEGEIKFFIDGDGKFPTIAGTGTEDYFNGNRDFVNQATHQYVEFSNPYSGMHLVRPEGAQNTQPRFSLYRWHIMDPIRFDKDLKVTIQALGWHGGGPGGRRYLPLEDDISSTAFWYQTEPHAPFPPLPGKDALEQR